MTKVGRNDPCPCGSGKKYKKCCEEKSKHKKFHAQVLSSTAQPQTAEHASKVSSLFFQKSLPSLSQSDLKSGTLDEKAITKEEDMINESVRLKKNSTESTTDSLNHKETSLEEPKEPLI